MKGVSTFKCISLQLNPCVNLTMDLTSSSLSFSISSMRIITQTSQVYSEGVNVTVKTLHTEVNITSLPSS